MYIRESDKEWSEEDFDKFNTRIGMYTSVYICKNGFGRKGYHLATRTFSGPEVEWVTIKQLTNQEIINALNVGYVGWNEKPIVRVKAKNDLGN